MQRDIIEFLQGERNAIRGDLILSRERAGNSEYYYVSSPQDEVYKPILKGWAKKLRPTQSAIPIATMEEKPVSESLKKPIHTGGKRSYVMIMQDDEAVISKLSVHAAGVLMKLICAGCVEWGTGKIVDKRSKKAMTAKEIYEKLSLKIADGKAILAELAVEKILTYNKSKRAYFIDRNLAKKGGFTDAD